MLPQLTTVRHVVVVGGGDPRALRGADGDGSRVHRWDELLAGQPDTLRLAGGGRARRRGAVLHVRHHRQPEGRRLQPPLDLPALDAGLHGRRRSGSARPTAVLAVVPMFHAMAWGLPYAAFLSGASLLMPDRFLQAAPLAAMIAAERPTLAGAVPTIWTDLLAYLDANPTDTSSLQRGHRRRLGLPARADARVLRAARHRGHPRLGHDRDVAAGLGVPRRRPAPTGDEAWAYRYTQGRVPAGVEARIVGPDGDGHAARRQGRRRAGGPRARGSPRGYLGDDEPDPEKFHDGWLRTGDVGMLSPDGYLTLTDRAKDVIKSGGEWIRSVELENALMAHPAVLEACVVGVPDERWGERPLATVVLREGATRRPPTSCASSWPSTVARWQLPERWAFIEAVPKTSVGKFDKKVSARPVRRRRPRRPDPP